jgi:hypothetical protein
VPEFFLRTRGYGTVCGSFFVRFLICVISSVIHTAIVVSAGKWSLLTMYPSTGKSTRIFRRTLLGAVNWIVV